MPAVNVRFPVSVQDEPKIISPGPEASLLIVRPPKVTEPQVKVVSSAALLSVKVIILPDGKVPWLTSSGPAKEAVVPVA